MRVSKKYHYDSLGEFTRHVEETRRKGGWDDGENSEGSWTMNTNMTKALKLSREGWHEGLNGIAARLEKIKGVQIQEVRAPHWDVVGDLFDVGKVVTGEPECWLCLAPDDARRLVKIGVNLVSSGGLSAEQMYHKGATVIALVDKLSEDPANVVELWALMGWGNYNSGNVEQWINMGTTPLDMDAVCFSMAHPAFMRIMGHSATNVHYGCRGQGFQLVDPLDHGCDIYIPTGHLRDPLIRNCETLEGAAKWVEARINETYRDRGDHCQYQED